ncbi:hypothetical protein GC207_10240 [bacterium]|nr:hypothetical protein [bacterium]
MNEDLLGKLAKAVDQIREIDDYLQKGAAAFQEWYPNLRCTMQKLRGAVAEMVKLYEQANLKQEP